METTPWDPEGVTVALQPDGRLAEGTASSGVDLKRFYKLLVAARSLDLRLSRSALPMWASAAGEEAAVIAATLTASAEDWIYPGLRDVAVGLGRGVDYSSIITQVLGRQAEGGAALPGRFASAAHRIAPSTDALGMHLALACGHAHGLRLQGMGNIVMALFGEGVTTTGAFHEACMLAVSADLPIVMVCRSQVWPDGAPAEAGVLGDSVADRARSNGLFVRRVDGADPIGVLAAIDAAAARARDGRGPGLVEVVVTPMFRDPPSHRDPIERLRRHLDAQGIWSQTFQDVIEAEVRTGLDRAFAELELGASAPPSEESV